MNYLKFSDVIKEGPSVGDVHVSTALGDDGKRHRRSFSETVTIEKEPLPEETIDLLRERFGYEPIGKTYSSTEDLPKAVRDKFKGRPKKLRQWMHVWNGSYGDHGDESRAFAAAWAAVGKRSVEDTFRSAFGYDVRSGKVLKGVRRQLVFLDGRKYAVPPFSHDPEFLKSVRPDQVPRLLYALTHRSEVEKRTIGITDLVAIQDRVKVKSVLKFKNRDPKTLPLVVRKEGRDYVADGHSRLTAKWLAGEDVAEVHLYELGDAPSLAMKRLFESKITFEVKKADPDQRLIFGWASVVTKSGKPIVDHQNDVIPVEELEKAFYDYVLSSRNHGHMHSNVGTGRLIECMVFTKQKQDLLGIDLGFEGAWVGYLVDDPDVWASHKRGELPEFSIGGQAVPVSTEMTVG